MSLFKTSTTLAAAASALLLAASASAGTAALQKVVHSTNGGPVYNSFGGCVVTKWDATSQECNELLTVEARTVYFDFNGSRLTPAAKAKLNALSAALKSRKVKSVSIIGYTDEIGETGYNLRLSKNRANAVAAYLRAKGIVVKGKSEVRGLGETASKSECEGLKGKEQRACLWRDRRVEVEIVE